MGAAWFINGNIPLWWGLENVVKFFGYDEFYYICIFWNNDWLGLLVFTAVVPGVTLLDKFICENSDPACCCCWTGC